jgi:hypothetical protein
VGCSFVCLYIRITFNVVIFSVSFVSVYSSIVKSGGGMYAILNFSEQ